MSHKRILVIGGSLVGLSTALFLRGHGVEVILAERHHGTAIHPRTPGYNARSMEYFRAAGVEEAVRAAGPWRLDGTGLMWTTNLSSDDHRWLSPPNIAGPEGFGDISPCEDAVLSQDVLEPVLREHAERFGGDLRFGTELTDFRDGPDGVTATLAERDTGRRYTVEADYLVAADGADSPIRQRLGIDRHGPGVMEHVAGVMVRADLTDVLRGKAFVICQVQNDDFSGMVRVVGDKLAMNVRYDPDEESIADFTPDRCIALARAAAGVDDLDVTPLEVLPWRTTAAVADRFRHGRIFLAGDAAHVTPPAGAYGANTGIQDAANLAWKLAAVSQGAASPALLDTYEAERRPIAELTVEQAMATGRKWFDEYGSQAGDDIELLNESVMKFGYTYPPQESIVEDPRSPTAAPGTRAGHVWFTREGKRLSTTDLWAEGFVLLTGSGGSRWRLAAEEVAPVGLPLTTYTVGGDDTHDLAAPPGEWARVFGVGEDGAVLIRPDGFIAWRATGYGTSPADALRRAVDTATGW